ncbi:MAG: energy transducer TonB [Lysobacter sp.]
MAKVSVCAWLGLALLLSGCGPAETVAGDEGQLAKAAPSTVSAASASESTERLLDRAMKAMQDGRITQPMGDNAVDLFVTLHGREPDNAAVKAALVELQPYMLLASERAIASGDVEDAERLIGAMAMFNPAAAPLPRLRASLDEVQQRLADVVDEVVDEVVAEAEAVPRAQPATPEPRATVADTVPTTPATQPPTAPDAPAATLIAAVPPAAAEAAPAPPQVADEAPPTLVRDVAPKYPLAAMRRGLSGRVRLEFTVRPDGGVADVVVVKATPEGVFDEAAVAAARQWRFEPRGAPATSARELRFDVPRG